MLSFLSIVSRPFKKRVAKAQNSVKDSGEKSKFIGSPLFNVLLMVALMAGASVFFRVLEWRRMNAQTQIQISDSENITDVDKTKNETARQAADIFGGEVNETSRRLRETGALGFAVCLSILDEARVRRQIPGSINGLLNAITSRDLMPPGLTTRNGEIRSPTSKIFIRYQPQPMQLELVSIPAEERFGPALMMRFPLTTADGKNIAYFQSSSVENVNLPTPFASASDVIHTGWTLEAWRGMAIGGKDTNQDFARMLAEEQQNLKTLQSGNDSTAR